jgi:beta-lactam-binding protein with PASTA domain
MDGTRTELVLPTDDAVTGGRYEAWFWLVQPTRTVAPNVVGLAQAEWRKALLEAGIPADVVDVQTQPSRQPKGSVLSMDPPAGTPLEPGARVRIVVSG